MKKKLKISYNAPVILSFVIICFVVTIIGIITKNRSTEMFFSIYRSSFLNPLTYLRLFTHVFGHIGLEHFMTNALFLLLLGPMLEEKYGSAAIVKVIIITAFVSGIIHCILWDNSMLCGASGVVFACIILSSFTAFKGGEIPLSFILVAVLFIGREIYSGITVQDNVSNLTHVLGGAVGSVSGYFLNKKS
ncbi:MAG: rhomboid family intramembrane serine protease [Oscillospiraceae bacterium]